MNLVEEAIQIVREKQKKLNFELRVTLPDMIKKAVELGDLSENADYTAALERQEMVKIQLGNISKRLSELSMINVDNLPEDEVSIGSEIKILDLDTDEEKTYRLVITEQTNPEIGYISVRSPVARAFLGKCEGDEVEVRTPQAVKNYEILKLKTIHDFKD